MFLLYDTNTQLMQITWLFYLANGFLLFRGRSSLVSYCCFKTVNSLHIIDLQIYTTHSPVSLKRQGPSVLEFNKARV